MFQSCRGGLYRIEKQAILTTKEEETWSETKLQSLTASGAKPKKGSERFLQICSGDFLPRHVDPFLALRFSLDRIGIIKTTD